MSDKSDKIKRAIKGYTKKKEGYTQCPNAPGGCYVALCECGKAFLASISCLKEICKVCGKPGSALHRQRFSRWISPLLWIARNKRYVGYLSVTIPSEFREVFKDRKELKEFRTYIKRKLQRGDEIRDKKTGKVKVVKRLIGKGEKMVELVFGGIKYGKMRYHWAGEEKGVYNPHLNILFGCQGWIEPEILEKWKEDIAKWLNERIYKDKEDNRIVYKGYWDKEESKFVKKVVSDYGYAKGSNLGWLYHNIKYVTRPTLLFIKNEEEREWVWDNVVKGFVNDIEFGLPGDVDLEDFTKDELRELFEEVKQEKGEIEAMLCILALGHCPCCFRRLFWKWKGKIEITDNGIYFEESFYSDVEVSAHNHTKFFDFHIPGKNIRFLGMGYRVFNVVDFEVLLLCGSGREKREKVALKEKKKKQEVVLTF